MDPEELYRTLRARQVPRCQLAAALEVFVRRCTGPQGDGAHRQMASALWTSTFQTPLSPLHQSQVDYLQRVYGGMDFAHLVAMVGGLRPSHSAVAVSVMLGKCHSGLRLQDTVGVFVQAMETSYSDAAKVSAGRLLPRARCCRRRSNLRRFPPSPQAARRATLPSHLRSLFFSFLPAPPLAPMLTSSPPPPPTLRQAWRRAVDAALLGRVASVGALLDATLPLLPPEVLDAPPAPPGPAEGWEAGEAGEATRLLAAMPPRFLGHGAGADPAAAARSDAALSLR